MALIKTKGSHDPSGELLPIPLGTASSGGNLAAYPDPASKVEIILTMRHARQSTSENHEALKCIHDLPHQRKYRSHKQLEIQLGVREEDLSSITSYFKGHKITIASANKLERRITLEGTVEQVEKALHTRIGLVEGPDKSVYRAFISPLFLPRSFHHAILHVDEITRVPKHERRTPTDPQDQDGSSKKRGYDTSQIARTYEFPESARGKGQCLGFIELGGVYNKADIERYFKGIGIKAPRIIEVGKPIFGRKDVVDNGEVTLDLQIAGTLVPEALLVIYYGHTIAEAMKLVIADTEHKPGAISISWAAPEHEFAATEIEDLNHLFFEAALLGITVVAASGDYGAITHGAPAVTLPSCHPLVLCCGGTNLKIDKHDKRMEVVWNSPRRKYGSGGGYSSLFPLAFYQIHAVQSYPFQKYNGRATPDVAANADPETGYKIFYRGKEAVIGGTSASTPLWASLIIKANEILGYRLGFIQPALYSFAGGDAFNQVLVGNNGYFNAAPNWNPCTGLGTPNGNALLKQLRQLEKKSDISVPNPLTQHTMKKAKKDQKAAHAPTNPPACMPSQPPLCPDGYTATPMCPSGFTLQSPACPEGGFEKNAPTITLGYPHTCPPCPEHDAEQTLPAYTNAAYTQPAYTQAAYTMAAYTQPAYTQPAYTQPAYTQPAYTQAAYTMAAYTQPAYTHPAYTQPAYTMAAYTQPAYTQVAYTQAAYTQAAYTQAAYTQAAYTQAAYTMAAYTQPAYTQPAYTQVAYTQAAYTQAAYTAAAYTQPAYTQAAYTYSPTQAAYTQPAYTMANTHPA